MRKKNEKFQVKNLKIIAGTSMVEKLSEYS